MQSICDVLESIFRQEAGHLRRKCGRVNNGFIQLKKYKAYTFITSENIYIIKGIYFNILDICMVCHPYNNILFQQKDLY